MSEHPNAAIARQLLELWDTGQLDRLSDYYTDDTVFHIAGHEGHSGTFRGRAEIAFALTRELQLRASATVHQVTPPESVLASDEYTMVFRRAQGERNGNTVDQTYVMATAFDANGKVKELWFLASDQAQYDRYWS